MKMREQPPSRFVIIVVVALIAGVMIGCSGICSGVKNNPIAEVEPTEKKLKPVLRINMASAGNKRILSFLSERLKKPSAELTDEDYAAVKSIDIRHTGNLDDISLISKCVNLQHLDLMNGAVLEDIKPLENLTKLESVILFGNKVSDLSPLSKLINLKYLDLNGCPASDLTPLHGLKSLEDLRLGAKISKEQVAQFKEHHPYVAIGYRNQPAEERIKRAIRQRLKNYSAELTDEDYAAVKSIRIIHTGNLDDISLISKCVNLQQLDLMNGGVLEDIKPLANLTKLESVGLWGNKVSDLSPLSKLINIKYLNLTYCPVTDITPLAGLKNLKRVEGLKKEVADELRKVLPNCEVK